MIKLFDDLFDGLSSFLGNSVEMSSVDMNTPSTYPFVSLAEINDSVYREGMDCCTIENFANKDYEVNIYTKNPSKKAKNDALFEKVDNYFAKLGFVRTNKVVMPEPDETIYRVAVRYSCVCSKDKTIYRR